MLQKNYGKDLDLKDIYLVQNDISKIIESNVELAVQINGKVRFKITVPTSFSEEEIKEQVKNDDKLTQYIDGKQIQKIIVIKSRIVNIVVK